MPARRNDGLEVNVEAVREHEQLARAQIGSNLFGIEFGRSLIGNQNHHHVGPLCRLGNRDYFEAGLLRLGDGFGIGGQANFTWTPESLRLRAWACPWEP